MSDSDRPSHGAIILVIEDDDETAADVQVGLVGAGYLVRRDRSADEAMVTLVSTRPDLILMSLMLPGTDGLILCATLKTRFSAPIIALSVRAGEVERALAIESGAVDVLTKPVDVDQLLGRVRALVPMAVSAHARTG
jgi:DNA-binding response OmpR family regulator